MNKKNFASGLKYFLLTIVIAMLFYNCMIAAIFLQPLVYVGVRRDKKRRDIRRMRAIKTEFASGIDSIAGAMAAGYSMESAIFEAYRDVKKLYGDSSETAKDFFKMSNEIKMNYGVERVLQEYSKGKEISEIKYFSDMVVITKKAGGNMTVVLKGIRNMIYEKIDIERQIEIVTASKRYESLVMSVMPLAIIMYLRIFSPDFIMGMYESITGVIIMTAVLLIYMALLYWMSRISKIEV